MKLLNCFVVMAMFAEAFINLKADDYGEDIFLIHIILEGLGICLATEIKCGKQTGNSRRSC